MTQVLKNLLFASVDTQPPDLQSDALPLGYQPFESTVKLLKGNDKKTLLKILARGFGIIISFSAIKLTCRFFRNNNLKF